MLDEDKLIHEIRVPTAYARAFEVKQGQFVSIIDIEGHQVADFIAFNKRNHLERLSPAHTRLALLSLRIKVGDTLRTNLRNGIFRVIEDTVGVHDLLVPACDERRYLVDYGVKDHRSCVANFEETLSPYGIERSQIPDPINVFENVPVDLDGKLVLKTSISGKGDRLVLQALMDTICSVSACPMDLNPTGGDRKTDIMVRIYEE